MEFESTSEWSFESESQWRFGQESFDSMTVTVNPYEGVDWNPGTNYYKSELHSHVRGDYTESDVEEMLSGFDYDVWARTEKDERHVADSDDMLTLPGVEGVGDDRVEHAVYLFTDATGGYDYVEDQGGVQWRAHPWDPTRDTYSFNEIRNQLESYDTMIGLEILNRSHIPREDDGDEFGSRRGEGQYHRASHIWDRLLADYDMLDVYGFGVSDGYPDTSAGADIYDGEFTQILADELTESAIKDSLESGQFFFVHNRGDGDPPKVNAIETGDEIVLDVEGEYEEIQWHYNGEIIARGDTFSVDDAVPGQNYLRFEVWTDTDDFYEADMVGSQPFGIELT